MTGSAASFPPSLQGGDKIGQHGTFAGGGAGGRLGAGGVVSGAGGDVAGGEKPPQ